MGTWGTFARVLSVCPLSVQSAGGTPGAQCFCFLLHMAGPQDKRGGRGHSHQVGSGVSPRPSLLVKPTMV